MTDINKEAGKKNFPQTEMPRFSLEEVVKLAETLRDNFAGSGASGINLAKAVGRSPSSSGWRILTGSAIAYGITDAGYNSNSISLTALGRQIVTPTIEGEDVSAKLTAVVQPSVLKNFYMKYDGSRVPKEDIAKNVLNSMGVPKERLDEAFKIALENARYLGVLTVVGDGQFIQLRSAPAAPKNGSLVLPRQDSKSRELIPPPRGDTEFEPNTERFPISDNKLTLLMSADFKNRLLDADGDELEKTWKEAKAALRKLAGFIQNERVSTLIPKTEVEDGGGE